MSRNLKIRIISAIIALIILLSVLFFFRVSGLVALVVLAHFVIFEETFNLIRLSHDTNSQISKPVLRALSFVVFCVVGFLATYSEMILVACLAIVGTLDFYKMNRGDSEGVDLVSFVNRSTLSLFTLIYSGLVPGLVVRLLLSKDGLYWFLFLLTTVFCGDILAYIFGKNLGRHKLLPAVSPNKTIEGAIGGLFGSLLSSFVFGTMYLPTYPLIFICVLGLVGGAFAQVGDLFESGLKRAAQVKDSGSIMPGHGGILDRLDGVLFATPIILTGVVILIG